jgi:competence protein ComEA
VDPPPSSSSPSVPAWLARLPDWARRPWALVAAVVGVAALVGMAVVFVLQPPAGPPPALTLPRADAGSAAAPSGPAPSTTAGMVTVHAAGAVASPGVYALPAAARVADVLLAAGGSLPDADLDRINLATRVDDGDRVYVPRRGEIVPPPEGSGLAGGTSTAAGPSTTASGPIDLNAATIEQLDTLPGIGPATAQAIVSYRNRHGRFRSVTELLEVPGIGPSKLEAIRTLVRV